MKTPAEDTVLMEMHAIKDAISAEFGHDIDALFDHLKTVEAGIRTGQGGVRPGAAPRKNLKSHSSTQAGVLVGRRPTPAGKPQAGIRHRPQSAIR